MTLIEAIKKAGARQGIYRSKWLGTYIIPTDTDRCCEVYVNKEFKSVRWNPKREDLLANDWKLA